MAISTGSSGKGRVNADINVTPMIDVMLVLLIIFMIVTPLLAAGFQAQMPSGVNVDQREEGKDEITLGIDVNGQFFVNKTLMSKDAAEALLKSLYANRTKDKLLYFKADIHLKYSKIQEGVEMGRRAGAKVLVAITEHKGGLMSTDKPKGK